MTVKSWCPPDIILDNEYASEMYGRWNEWSEAMYHTISVNLAVTHNGPSQMAKM